MTARIRHRHGWLFHSTTAISALAAIPKVHAMLRTTANGSLPTESAWAFAWGLTAVAWGLHRAKGWWVFWTALWALLVGMVTDLPVVHDSVTYLTGAAW